jgi:hypothetical protein
MVGARPLRKEPNKPGGDLNNVHFVDIIQTTYFQFQWRGALVLYMTA